MSEFRCGFVAVVGPTNSGKSTLLNQILGKKISITSPRPQTTYHAIRGILTRENFQIVFTDTPGFQFYSESTARLLNRVSERSAAESEVLLWVFDVTKSDVLKDLSLYEKRIAMWSTSENRIAVLNKIDAIAKPDLLPLLEKFHESKLFSELVPVSAKKGSGVDRLVPLVASRIPLGEQLFPAGQITDRALPFLIAERVREKVYRATRLELPYSVRVELEDPGDIEHKIPHYFVRMHVDSESRKAILIGKGGEMLKSIGTSARHDLEKYLGHKICLKILVDVEKDWRLDKTLIHQYLELS